jgi:nicotinamide mononucleotide transporter
MTMTYLEFLELLGVITALLYLVLVTHEKLICWAFYILSSLLFIPIFWSAQLYADAALQLYFIGMGVYAFRTWHAKTEIFPIRSASHSFSMAILLSILLSGLAIGYSLSKTDAGNFAYFDGVITSGSIITTVLTAKKILQGWHFWIALNLLATAVFAQKGLSYTVWLYGLYVVLSYRALRQWQKHLKQQPDRKEPF